jgi:16S rRNA (cytidine1402-2'-O)-methyltransferase
VSGQLFIVATPIGNLADISERAADTLRTVDLVACEDTRRTSTLLRHVGSTVKMLATHEHNEAERAQEIAARIEEGETIALVTDAGMPSVSDPGRRVVAAVRAAGLDVVVVPGASAVETALVASGFPTDLFTFVGFFPRQRGQLDALLERVEPSGATIIGFESPNRVAALLTSLAARDPERHVAVCRELTKLHEEVVVGQATELARRFAGMVRGEITVVLAPLPAAEPDAAALASAAALARAAGLPTGAAADLLAAIGPWSRNDAYRAVLLVRGIEPSG